MTIRYTRSATLSLMAYMRNHIRDTRGLSLSTVKKFLNEGADPNTPVGIGRGITVLMMATWQHGNEGVVRELVRAGASVNHPDATGKTALMHAAGHGTLKNVLFLLANGADINHQNKHGETALMHAAWSGHEDVVRELLLLGADAKLKSNYGGNAVKCAEGSGESPRKVQRMKEIIEAATRLL